jgi:hypothetical protein
VSTNRGKEGVAKSVQKLNIAGASVPKGIGFVPEAQTGVGPNNDKTMPHAKAFP